MTRQYLITKAVSILQANRYDLSKCMEGLDLIFCSVPYAERLLFISDVREAITDTSRAIMDALSQLEVENGAIEVGMGATVHLWSDSHAYTVIAVSKSGKTITLQRDKATLSPDFKQEFIPGGFLGHTVNNHEQGYTYEANPNGSTITVRFRNNKKQRGFFTSNGLRVGFGYRSEFYDYNF